jgi:hypothetical protein
MTTAPTQRINVTEHTSTLLDPTPGQVSCYHGGAFFEAIGTRFEDLGRRHQIINADVLDAWFDPAPRVIDALGEHLP